VPVAAFAVPQLQIATWAVVQGLFSIPLLLYTVATRLLGAAFSWRGRSEKFLHPDPEHRSGDLRPKHLLSVAAVLPIKIARTALPVDSRFHSLLDTVEAQLAFWQMQRRAVETGVTTAHALARLLQAVRGVESARIHFLGHSFGGLVAASASRQFMDEGLHASDNEKPLTATMESLTLLLPAMASHWFEQEEHLQKAIRGTIACLHSRHDTANGFFYPLANHGQRSAGSHGLAGIDRVASETARSADSFPRLVNRDLSAVCCDGSRLAGGGHGDIFKDEVLHVVWQETTARPVTAHDLDQTGPSSRS
jgi:pimeloyl-ACP methyl ester carboxylesterase